MSSQSSKPAGDAAAAAKPASDVDRLLTVDEELRSFLANQQPALHFPPSDQGFRHAIHERAFNLGLVAVSEGEGANRHAVVYKPGADSAAIEHKINKFLMDPSVDRLEMPPAIEPIRYTTRITARKKGLAAISEGVGDARHVVIWKSLDERKIQEQLRRFAASDANRLDLPPASGKMRYFTATAAEDIGLTSISEGDGKERHVVLYKVAPPQHLEVKRKQLLEVFQAYDTDKSGELTLDELTKAMTAAGLPKNFAENLMQAADTNKDGKLDFEEFFQFVHKKDKDIRAVFNALDIEHNGTISVDKLRVALKMLNLHPSNHDWGLLKALAEKHGKDGTIRYEEFRNFCAVLAPVDFTRLADEWMWASNDALTSAVPRAPAVAQDAKGFPWSEVYSAFSGGFANAIARTVVAPTERVRLQMSVDPGKFPTTMSCFRHILKEEGWKGYWRGNWINVIRIFPQGAVAFLTKDYFTEVFGGKKATPVQLMFSSMLAGMFCMTAVYPLDMIRGRVTTMPGLYKGLWDGLRTVRKEEGFRALFLGLGPANAWAVPYYGMQFFTYENLKRGYADFAKGPDGRPASVSPSLGLVFGAISGAVCVTTAYPFELVRRRLQVQGPSLGLVFGAISGAVCVTTAYPFELVRRRLQVQGVGGRPIKYNGFFDCVRKVWAQEGVKGFFRGLNANLMKTPLSTAVVFYVYEAMIKHAPEKFAKKSK